MKTVNVSLVQISKSLALASLVTTSMVACAPSADDIPNPLNVRPAGVNGPDLTGTWVSDCLAGWSSTAPKRQFTFKIEGQNLEHTERTFVDSNCREVAKTESTKGTLSYKRELPNAIFVTEFKIPISANVSTWKMFNVNQKDGVVRVSEFFMDLSDAEKARTEIVLTKGSSPTAPESSRPVPATTIESSYYVPVSGHTSACPHVVSTAMVGSQLNAVYIDFQAPCRPWTLTMSCSQGVCTGTSSSSGSRFRLNVIDARTYDFSDLTSAWTAVYKSR